MVCKVSAGRRAGRAKSVGRSASCCGLDSASVGSRGCGASSAGVTLSVGSRVVRATVLPHLLRKYCASAVCHTKVLGPSSLPCGSGSVVSTGLISVSLPCFTSILADCGSAQNTGMMSGPFCSDTSLLYCFESRRSSLGSAAAVFECFVALSPFLPFRASCSLAFRAWRSSRATFHAGSRLSAELSRAIAASGVIGGVCSSDSPVCDESVRSSRCEDIS